MPSAGLSTTRTVCCYGQDHDRRPPPLPPKTGGLFLLRNRQQRRKIEHIQPRFAVRQNERVARLLRPDGYGVRQPPNTCRPLHYYCGTIMHGVFVGFFEVSPVNYPPPPQMPQSVEITSVRPGCKQILKEDPPPPPPARVSPSVFVVDACCYQTPHDPRDLENTCFVCCYWRRCRSRRFQ